MSPRAKDPKSLTETIRLRVSKDDKAELERRAAKAGITLTEWVRSTLLGARAVPPVSAVVVGTPDPIPGQVTVEELLEVHVDPVVAEEIAAEVAEVALEQQPPAESEEAFLKRRTLQLHGQGATKPVARMKAAQEWEER